MLHEIYVNVFSIPQICVYLASFGSGILTAFVLDWVSKRIR